MGYSYAENIRAAGQYLLEILDQNGSVEYARFYDGSETTAHALYTGMGLTIEEGESYCAEHLIDLAAAQLERQGFVHTEILSSKLADGEPNYSIQLAPSAQERIASGEQPTYWDVAE